MQKTRQIYLILILSILSLTRGKAQDTYVKSFNVNQGQSDFSTVLELSGDEMFLGVHTLCEKSKCLLISKLSTDGNIIWNKGFKSSDSGNYDFIKVINDTIYASGHEDWNSRSKSANYYLLEKHDGDSLTHATYNYDSIVLGSGFVNMGLIVHQEQVLIYGEFRDTLGIVEGLIQWAKKDGSPIRTKTYQIPVNMGINALQDLQPDGYGNLVFITVRRVPPGIDHATIRKIDHEGTVIKDIVVPSDRLLEPRPQMAVNAKKQYIFSHKTRNANEGKFLNVVQLVCTDTLGNFIWVHNYPTTISAIPRNPTNTVSINQITPTRDGGVIICAHIKTNRDQRRFYRDAYIGKFDSIGTLEWERRINILNGLDTLYDNCELYDIKERPDGKGYVAVGAHTSSTRPTAVNILLVSIGNDGCIEGLPCVDDHLVVPTLDVIDLVSGVSKVNIYPNPFTDMITITLEASAHLRISDLTGKSMVDQAMEAGTSTLTTSSWQAGMYIVTLRRSDGSITSHKLIK